jgi:hypothetical protein
MGIIVNIRVEILSSPRMVCLLTLMSGQCHRRRRLVNRIAFVGSWVRRAGSSYLFILATNADAWASHYFLSNETCFPKILEPIKQHLKNHKNTNNSYLDI